VSEDSAPERPVLRIVRGDATPEELAALVAVLSARGGGGAPAAEPVRSAWGRPGTGMQGHLATHTGAWKESGFAQGVRTRADW